MAEETEPRWHLEPYVPGEDEPPEDYECEVAEPKKAKK